MKQKTLKVALIIAGIIVIFLLLLPGIAKRYISNNSKELVGRQLNIDKLKVNYFTGTVKVFNFKMLEQNEKDNFITFDTLTVNIEPLQLLKNNIEVESLFLKGLDVNVSLKDSIYNFDDLIAFYSEEDSIPKEVEEPFKYNLSNLDLKDASFHFNDKNIEHITEINNLSFVVPFIGWDQENKSKSDVKFDFENGGYIESKLNFNPISGEFDSNIIIDDLKLDAFYKYVAEYAEINNFDGLVDSNLHIVGNTNNPIESIISGQVQVNDFIMTDEVDKNFLSAKKIEAGISKLDFNNSNYIIDSLKINKSYTYFKLDSLSNNFSRIFKLDNDNAVTDTKTEVDSTNVDELYYSVNYLDLNQGVLDYTDNLTGTPFKYHLNEITIQTDSISSDAKWLDVHSEMLLNNRGTLKADLGLNPSNYNNANLDFTIENFLLSDINIYSNYYTGHSIIKGDMFYTSTSIVTNGVVESENSLTVKNVSLKNEEGGLYSLPLKFALFLLKDKNGDVKLDIPIAGNVNDPSLNVGKLVWRTFSNLIIKTAASPGRLLAGLVGGNAKDIEEITFDYLDIEPKEKQAKQLNKLLELEQKKEGLKIDLIYFVDEQLQKQEIAKQEAGKLYLKETQKDYLKDIEGFEVFLHKKMALDSINKENLYWSIISRSKVDSIASNTTKLLILNTEKYLQTKNDSTLIKVSKSNIDTPDFKVISPTLKVEYSIE